MQDALTVQIVDSKAYLDEDLPDEVVCEQFPILFLDVGLQVAVVAVLHDYVDLSVFYEGVQVTNNEGGVEFS